MFVLGIWNEIELKKGTEIKQKQTDGCLIQIDVSMNFRLKHSLVLRKHS